LNKDEIAIREIVKCMERAWNGSDSHGFAAPFVDDANFIHIFGGQLDGRPAIEASHRAIFNTIYKNSVLRFEVRSVRFVHPDVAIAFTQGNITFRDPADKREINARPTMILVKVDGVWSIVAFQNTRVSELPSAVEIPESSSAN
jgi:uncharacterized protein (TIGR02246 family)